MLTRCKNDYTEYERESRAIAARTARCIEFSNEMVHAISLTQHGFVCNVERILLNWYVVSYRCPIDTSTLS